MQQKPILSLPFSFLVFPHAFLFLAVKWTLWFVFFLVFFGALWREPIVNIFLISFVFLSLAGIYWLSRRFHVPIRQIQLQEYQLTPAPYAKNDSLPDNFLNGTTRSRAAEGKDEFEGTYSVIFPPDTMTVTIHVSFYPPFESVPEIKAFTAYHDEVTLRVSLAKVFGVRIDVKRMNTDTHDVLVTVLASGS